MQPPSNASTGEPSPLAIGGLGGSGTRVVAAAAIALGIDLGDDHNRALDNLAFTLLFKDREAPALPRDAFAHRVAMFVAAMTGAGALSDRDLAVLATIAAGERGGEDWTQHRPGWLAERVERLATRAATPRAPRAWGWKEPNTHMVLAPLLRELPGLRYVHVSRNALDMAFTRNTNQLMYWGPGVLGRRVRPVPRDALAFWCEADRRVRRIGAAMGDRFMRLEHDRLCADPRSEFARLARFVGGDPGRVDDLARLVDPPSTIGRHRDHDLDALDPADLAYLRDTGQLVAASEVRSAGA